MSDPKLAELIAMSGRAMQTERAQCTLCASEPSPGFYTGCMIQDGAATKTGWNCDGKGNLTRETYTKERA